MPLGVVIQQPDGRLCNRRRIVKGNQEAAPVREQFLRMPIGCGDNCFPGAQSDCQRAGDNLRFLPVRTAKNRRGWWWALVSTGPGWVGMGSFKLFAGSYRRWMVQQVAHSKSP